MDLIKRLKRTHQDWQREDQYWAEIAANHDPLLTTDPQALRLYCLVRSDILPPIQSGIQAAHAIAELFERARLDEFKAGGNWSALHKWAMHDKTIILLESSAPEKEWVLDSVQHAIFREPDLDNIVTAVALKPMMKGAGDVLFNGRELAR